MIFLIAILFLAVQTEVVFSCLRTQPVEVPVVTTTMEPSKAVFTTTTTSTTTTATTTTTTTTPEPTTTTTTTTTIPASTTTTVFLDCPLGWRQFTRTLGAWCIQVFRGAIAAEYAEAACQNVGGTLTGVENEQERLFIHSEALKYVAMNSKTYTVIGGQRRAPCYADNWLTLPDCMPKETRSFEWTDGFTSGDAGWAWQTTNPDNYLGDQNYLALIIATGKYLTDDPSIIGQVTAPMDDVAGTQVGGYACGKPLQ